MIVSSLAHSALEHIKQFKTYVKPCEFQTAVQAIKEHDNLIVNGGEMCKMIARKKLLKITQLNAVLFRSAIRNLKK